MKNSVKTNTKKEVTKKTTKQLIKKTQSPKWFEKANATIKALNDKENRTQFDAVRLANQMYKIENRSLSKVYRELQKPSAEIKPIIKEILGKSKFPTFAEFSAKAKEGQIFFSIYSGLLMLKKFNRIEQTRAKVKRQNKTTAKK